MSGRDNGENDRASGSHERAAEDFATRATAQFDSEIGRVILFGSTARGQPTGLASDVDVLVVLSDVADRSSVVPALRDLAYDVMLEHGPVVELHVLTRTEFEDLERRRNPFVRNVVREGRSYA